MLALSESLYVETHCKLFDVTFNNVDTFYTATRQKSRAYSGLVRSNTCPFGSRNLAMVILLWGWL